jgi:hypothetical protein
MKLRFLLLIVPLVIFAADGKKAGDKSAQAAPKTAKAPEPGVPAGAAPAGPNSWRFQDAQGQSWIYRKTPFGITRIAEEKPHAAEELPPGLKAVELSDTTVEFVRPGPFGPTRWTRKKDQLTDLERRVWERDCAKNDQSAKPAAKE